MKIEAGKYYRRRDNMIVGPMVANGDWFYPSHTRHWDYDGRGIYRPSPAPWADLIEEVTVTPVLGFELRAGGKYVTVKPDGTPGPVITLRDLKWDTAVDWYLPFRADGSDVDRLYVSTTGDCVDFFAKVIVCRITAEYIDPPPTITERLEAACNVLARPSRADDAIKLIEGCIADLKAQEAKP